MTVGTFESPPTCCWQGNLRTRMPVSQIAFGIVVELTVLLAESQGRFQGQGYCPYRLINSPSICSA